MIKDTPHCPPSLSISFFFPTFPPRLFQNFTYKLPYIYIYIYIYMETITEQVDARDKG